MNLEENLETQKEESQPRISGLASAGHWLAEGFADGMKPLPPADYLSWAQRNVVFGAEHAFPGPYNPQRFKVRTKGFIRLPVSGAAITDVGKDVYASDDNTFTFTKGSNTHIGYVKRFDSTGFVIVHFAANFGTEAELTDSSGGTAADTIAAIGGTYSQSEVRNAIASLAGKVNYLLRRLGQ